MNIIFPSSSDKDPKRKAWGQWLSRIRGLYRQGKLEKFKIKMFEQFPGWEWDLSNNNSTENKKKLLEMAKNSEPRPNRKKHPLGNSLSNYLSKSQGSYDPEFDKQIRKLAPHWFVDTTIEKKKQLLEMAKNKEPRPNSRKHPLAKALFRYVNKGDAYDHKFDTQIRKLAPHWFINTATENKKKLLEMVKNKKPRPHWKCKLAINLVGYTNKCYNRWYDPQFDKKIRKLAPQWFGSRTKKANEKKKKLLEMAKNGEPKPNQKKHPLGKTLSSYICKGHNSYDPEFTKEIKKSHWFQ